MTRVFDARLSGKGCSVSSSQIPVTLTRKLPARGVVCHTTPRRDGVGGLVNTYSYDPYGKADRSVPSDKNTRTFTGREDDATGLLYYRARYYDAGVGKFISSDPLGISGGSVNLYSYVANDPMNRIDPSGEKFVVGPYQQWFLSHFNPKRLKALYDAFELVNAPYCRCAVSTGSGYPDVPWDTFDIEVGFDSLGNWILGGSGYAVPWDHGINLTPRDDDSVFAYAAALGHEVGHFRAPYLGHSDNPKRFTEQGVCGNIVGAHSRAAAACGCD